MDTGWLRDHVKKIKPSHHNFAINGHTSRLYCYLIWVMIQLYGRWIYFVFIWLLRSVVEFSQTIFQRPRTWWLATDDGQFRYSLVDSRPLVRRKNIEKLHTLLKALLCKKIWSTSFGRYRSEKLSIAHVLDCFVFIVFLLQIMSPCYTHTTKYLKS